jgi:hypothetical protein
MPAAVVELRVTPQPAIARPAARPSPRGRAGLHAVVIVGFAVPAVVLYWHAWDGHLASTLTCACGDPGQTVWFLAWPAYALAHGLDPFFSGAVQAPYGANLLANASTVPVGIVLAPLTLTAGPVVATNLALTLCPALSAWGCWVACRDLVAWAPATIVAGLLFGYSPFIVSNMALGHLGLTLLVTPPLLLVATRHVLFEPPDRRVRWAVALGVLVALQFFLSAEMFAIVLVGGVPCTLVGVLARRRLPVPPRELLLTLGVAATVAGCILAAPVWFSLAGPQHLHGPLWRVEGNTLDRFWSPGNYGGPAEALERLGGYEGRAGPSSSYLGPVVLLVAAGALAAAWRRRGAWLLALGGTFAAVCSLGALLWLTPGHAANLWLPWRIVASWPLFYDVIPQRFSAVVDLSVALLIAVGMDAVHSAVIGHRRADLWRTGAVSSCFVAAVVAVGSLWWTYQVPFTTRTVALPAWYEVAAPVLAPGTVVLSYPFPFSVDGASGPMVWQAEDGMRFRLAGGYMKEPGPGGRPLTDQPVSAPYSLLAPLTSSAGGRLPSSLTTAQIDALRNAVVRWRVDEVVVVPRGRDPHLAVRIFSRALRRPPLRVFGAWVWRLRH